MKNIASVSFGKDSLAMLLILLERNYPLDEVMYYNTGAEFQSVLNNRDKMIPILERRGIKFTELTPKTTFEYEAFERPVKYRDKEGYHYGFGWCGGPCRWRTRDKQSLLASNSPDGSTVYIGLAFDELSRIAKLNTWNLTGKFKKFSPLFQWGMTEADCLQYCYDRGWNWDENGIDLYSILDRVSCWCCANKNKKELMNIYQNMPEYWEKLKDFQSKTKFPMKTKWCNKEYGKYGNVFRMEEVFKAEIKKEKLAQIEKLQKELEEVK